MKTEKILDILERIELQLGAVWWDCTLYFIYIEFFFLVWLGMAVKSFKLIFAGSIAFIFLLFLKQILEKKELNKIRREYEKTRKEIPAQQERDMQNL